MEHPITIDLPEEVYGPLQESVEQTGLPPEQIVINWVLAGMEKFQHDPLEDFFGAFSSGIPDWTEKHDEYLGKTLAEEMRNTEE